ncbi:MAG: hypothetical protein AB1753_08265 [Thermoproteota archaeon]
MPEESELEKYKPPVTFEYISSFAVSAATVFANQSGDPFIQSVVTAATNVSQLLFLNNSPYLQRKLKKLLTGIEGGIKKSKKVQEFDFSSLSEDDKDRLVAACMHVMQIATRSRDHKMEQLSNAILNAAVSYDIDEDLQVMFVRYIDEFTPSHMEMLAFLQDSEFEPTTTSSFREDLEPRIYEAIKSVKPEFEDVNFFRVIFADLRSKALIAAMARKTPEQPYHNCMTDLGKKFLQFVTLPQ